MSVLNRLCPAVGKRTVLVISDAKYFQNYTNERGDEFVKGHPDGKIRRHPGRVVMFCEAMSNAFLNSWNYCTVMVTYWRIASVRDLRGINGPVDIEWQVGYRPRNMHQINTAVMIIGRDIEVS